MSMPLTLMMRRGFTHAAHTSTNITIAADQDDFLPVSEALWGTRNLFRITSVTGGDRIVTGWEADGARTIGNPGTLHSTGLKHFIAEWGPSSIAALLLRHNNGSSIGSSRMDLQESRDLLVLPGDSWSMYWGNPRWIIRDVTRGPKIRISPPDITVDQTDYDPTGWRVADRVFLVSDAPRTIHSLAADDGVLTSLSWLAHKNEKRIYNEGPFDILFPNESATGTAEFKFLTFNGADLTLASNNFVDAYYDDDLERWRLG